jgi:hypothetical protein
MCVTHSLSPYAGALLSHHLFLCVHVCVRGSVCSPLSSYDFVFLKFGASRLTCVSGTLRLSNVVLRPQLPTPSPLDTPPSPDCSLLFYRTPLPCPSPSPPSVI